MGEWVVLFWLALAFGGLILISRWLTRHIQGLGLLIFEDERPALGLYYLALFPGVLLHELSHLVAAKSLWVRTGKLSLFPRRRGDDEVLLGSVQISRTDPVRASLIGLAPLLVGCVVILSIARWGFELGDPGHPLSGRWIEILVASLKQPGFGLWLYLTFAVSNAMLPSGSDRREWLPALAFVAALLGGLYLLGWFPGIWLHFGEWALWAAQTLCYILGISLAASAAFAVLVFVLERLAGWIRGMRVEY